MKSSTLKMPNIMSRSVSVIAFLVVMAVPFTSRAQYSLKQSSFSTIGGKSTGGSYSLRSSTSQPTAGAAMSGGTFSLQGSPWNVIVLQSSGGPLLSIGQTNGLLRVSWPTDSAGFLLQETAELRTAPATTPWANSALTVADNGTEKSVTIAPGAGLKYFRLQKAP